VDGYFKENMAYSDVNDAARELQAIVARNHQDNNGTLDSTGATSSYRLACSTSISAGYNDGDMFRFRAHAKNDGGTTLDVVPIGGTTLSAMPVVNTDLSALAEDQIVNGGVYDVVFKSVSASRQFQLLNPSKGRGIAHEFGDIDVLGDASISGTLAVTGVTTLRDDVSISGSLAVLGDVSISGAFSVTSKIRGSDRTATDIGMGGEVVDGNGNWQPMGMAVTPIFTASAAAAVDLRLANNQNLLFVTNSSASVDIDTTTDNAKDGMKWEIVNVSGGNVSITATGVTLTWQDGAGGQTGARTLADGSTAVVTKRGDGQYLISGNGLT